MVVHASKSQLNYEVLMLLRMTSFFRTTNAKNHTFILSLSHPIDVASGLQMAWEKNKSAP
jgi:hypothetical protein